MGTPVAINGLKNAINLNSKVGDVRSSDNGRDYYAVRLGSEDQPVSIKRGNLSINLDCQINKINLIGLI